MHPYIRYAVGKQANIIALIKDFVQCESPSESPTDVNRFVDLLAQSVKGIAVAKTFQSDRFGKHLRLEFKLPGARKEGQILGVGHSDTVWSTGTIRSMPFRRRGGRLYGPGVLDMKSGLTFFIYAVRALRALDVPVHRKVVLLIVSDEEVGSTTSRPITESEAKRSDCVLVLEPGTGLTGKLKTARKGVGNYTVSIEGRAAHAGVDFGNGASAILEAARQIEKLAGFTNLGRGTTVNPGVISGGTRTNVIAAAARIDVDVRVSRLKDAATLDRRFRSLKPFDKRCRIRVEGGLNRPPMERNKAIAHLFTKAQRLCAELGLRLEESSTGGGSDGNFTAALGIPTLDGLGGVGEGAHAINESLLIDCIPERVAALAALIAGL